MPASHALIQHVVIAGKYVLGEELGAGGMGVVYRAQQLDPPRPVAIKFLHRLLARDPRTVERFRVEALAAARLDHPSTVAVLDHGEDDDGTPYLVMEYVSGRTLRRIVDDGSLAMDRAFANIVTLFGGSLVDAALMCATNPARAMGLVGHGAIVAGGAADLVVLDRRFQVLRTFIAGAEVFAREV